MPAFASRVRRDASVAMDHSARSARAAKRTSACGQVALPTYFLCLMVAHASPTAQTADINIVPFKPTFFVLRDIGMDIGGCVGMVLGWIL